jgi:hypothetical protein
LLPTFSVEQLTKIKKGHECAAWQYLFCNQPPQMVLEIIPHSPPKQMLFVLQMAFFVLF